MLLLSKEPTDVFGVDKEVTWYNGSSGYVPSNLDHVVASDHMDVRSQGGGPSDVSVLGWTKLPQDQRSAWFEDYSDHALLYFEVWG